MKRWKDFGLNAAIALLALAAVGMVSLRAYDRFWGRQSARPEIRKVPDWREYAAVGYRIGSPGAPVTIVEFSDFQCPICKRASEGLREIRRRHPGEVSIVFRHFPLPMHDSAMGAARAAHCASEQGAFEAYHDLLFSSQESIGRRSWVEYAQSAGITDAKSFEGCATGAAAHATVERDLAAGRRIGVTGTPTFLINDLEVSGYQGDGRAGGDGPRGAAIRHGPAVGLSASARSRWRSELRTGVSVMRPRCAFGLLSVALLIRPGAISGQSGQGAERFEVASIKPVRSTGDVIGLRFDHGRVSARNVSLATLIEFCFDAIRNDDQILNGPKWIFSETFEVEAKPSAADADHMDPGLTVGERNRSVERTQSRLRLLLEDRFQLKTHTQTREIKGYALMVGTQGAKFLQSRLPDGKPGGLIRPGPGRLSGPSVHMPLLATRIGQALGAPVADKTGLSGYYNIDLTWTPDVAPPSLPASGDEVARAPVDVSGPSIFTAVQEQLGLKLIPEKQTGVVLVIDHVERPSAN